jgi:hypothetical protein
MTAKRGIPETSEKILEILRQTPREWVSRSAIAEKLGRKRLNPYDLAALTVLAEKGQIKEKREKMPGYIGFQWVYRINE